MAPIIPVVRRYVTGSYFLRPKHGFVMASIRKQGSAALSASVSKTKAINLGDFLARLLFGAPIKGKILHVPVFGLGSAIGNGHRHGILISRRITYAPL